MSTNDTELGPCPACGERKGTLHEGDGQFPYFVICSACAWTTVSARFKSIAVKLWNEATPRRPARAKRG